MTALSLLWNLQNTTQCHLLTSLLTRPIYKFPSFYETQKFVTRVHKSPLLASIPSLINSDYTHSPYFFKMHFNIILSRTFCSCKWCLTFRLHYQYFMLLFTPVHATCPSYLLLPYFNTLIIIDKTPTHAIFIQHYISLGCWFH